MVEAPAVHGPELAGDRAAFPVGRRLQVVVEPDEVERGADPCDAGHDVDRAAQEVEPLEDVGFDHEPRAEAPLSVDAPAFSARASLCRNSWAATATAIAAGSLLRMPPIPIGMVSRSIAAAAKPH